jgi:putative sterol carrier protein
MPKFLSQEWLELRKEMSAAMPERLGATARIQNTVKDGPEGDVTYYEVLIDGRLAECGRGPDERSEVQVVSNYADMLDVLDGKADRNTLFMQGRAKVTGNMAKLLALLPLTQSPEYKVLEAELREKTER